MIPSSYASLRSPGLSDIRSFTISTCIRSALIFLSVGASACMPRLVSFSISNPSCAANRIPRSILKASSENRSLASPTQRITFAFRSSAPPKISTSPSVRLYAMALTVKSLLLRSSLRLLVNVTSFGCRPSSYFPSIRYVVTSKPSPSRSTVTVPCSIPVSNVLPNNSFVSSGVADVVISQSPGSLSSMESLTHPPTAYASYPCSCNLVMILSAFSGR